MERALGRLDGVQDISVNLATKKATMKYDSNLIELPEIKKAIEDAGYIPQDLETEISDDIDRMKKEDEEIKTLQKRLITAAIFAVPLFYISWDIW